jgi:hypothetical protein
MTHKIDNLTEDARTGTPKDKRRVSPQGKAAMARSGAANLRAWKEGVVTPAVEQARARVARFEKGLRDEFPDPSPVESGLIESALSSYSSLMQVRSLQSLGCRLNRIERTHAVAIEASRSLLRVLRVLVGIMDSPEHRTDAVKRSLGAIPAPTEEQRKAAEEVARKRYEENKARFACFEKGYDGPEPTF